MVETLNEVFMERGPVFEILMDNALSFHSEAMTNMLKDWDIKPLFRAAYRPSGNGIVERHHRTIKSIAERANITPQMAVYWYNMTARSGTDPSSVPHHSIYQYTWKWPLHNETDDLMPTHDSIKVGDEVWVKPANVRCTTRWTKGNVTGIVSSNNIIVDGVPRHILDIRKVIGPGLSTMEEEKIDTINEKESSLPVRRNPTRIRQPPGWIGDYEV